MSAGDDRYKPAIASNEPSRCKGAVRSWEINDQGGNRVEVVDYTRGDSAFEAYGASSKGPKRERDEDFILATRLLYPESSVNESVFVLCDGAGGREAGDEISQFVATHLAYNYAQFKRNGYNGRSLDTEAALRTAARITDRDLKGETQLVQARAATTAVICVLNEVTGEYVLLNIGDSSASLVNARDTRRFTSRHENKRGHLINYFGASPDAEIQFEDGLEADYHEGILKESPVVIHRGVLNPGEALVIACDGADRMTHDFPRLLRFGVSGDGKNPAFQIAERANEIDGSDNVSAIVITGKRRVAGLAGRPQSSSQYARQAPEVETGKPNPVERSPQKLMAEAKTPQELWGAIGREQGIQGRSNYFTQQMLYEVATDVLEGKKGVTAATSGDGFRDAVERVGCRNYTKNMLTGGHEGVFKGADLRWGEEQALYSIIDQLGVVAGTAQEFQPADLKRIAQRVLSGEVPPTAATRTQGFRVALTKMLEGKNARK